MTDRHAGYVVVLAEDVREDDAEGILNAIRMIRGVASAEPIIADLDIHIAQSRADQKWRERLYELLREPS